MVTMPTTRATGVPEAEQGVPVSLMMAVALLTAVTLELVRSTGPLLEIAFDISVYAAAGTAAATYLVAAVMGLALVIVTRRSDGPTVLLVGVIALAAARLVTQGVTGDTRFVVGLATIALSIAVFTLGVAVLAGREKGGHAAATAIAFGAAFGVGIQLALGTWDAYWRHDVVGWGITVVVLVGLIGAAQGARRNSQARPTRHVQRVWVLGPALSLMWIAIANGGFAASQSGVRLAIAGPVAAAGLLLAGTVIAIVERNRSARHALSLRAARFAIPTVPAVAIAGLSWATGPVVLVLVVAAQLAAFAIIAQALDGTPGKRLDQPTVLVRVAASASLVGLGTILPPLIFQLDYDIPLGFPNKLVIVAAAVLLGTAAAHRRDPMPEVAPAGLEPPDRSILDRSTAALLLGAGAMVLVGGSLAVGRAVSVDPQPDLASDAGPLTLVSWNLHYGVNPQAGVDLEQIARSIEEQNPSIVILQEVSRGWVLGGGTDMATWLAQRLKMNVSYAPAADRQFGNAILTNLATSNVTSIDLPYGNGPQDRSAISVEIAMPGGPLRVTSVHLQNKNHIPTRIDQIDTLLDAQADAPMLVIAGDFNAQPNSPEIDKMTDSGLVSAQDASGDPSALTDPSINPDKRIDWVFGRGVSFGNTEVLADALSSDHLPLVVTFAPE